MDKQKFHKEATEDWGGLDSVPRDGSGSSLTHWQSRANQRTRTMELASLDSTDGPVGSLPTV
ncbi:hypothetical protein CEE69_12315 [Rhodopirellula bahusiensis]|uniref:Uncharacterized protein n=1 Tax=Rhodopirellula bahusiensis TaxID=2014065 RepID=A0A2G1W849_9BACT|nr:hypothetical protein CEE69_12315 [Rhodopirellula bahusiensis]